MPRREGSVTRPNSPRTDLVGRADDCGALRQLLQDVRGGRSRVLILRGDAGVGKTALLEYAVDVAEGFQVSRATGVETEMELPFAGLHQLCLQVLDRLSLLPAPQRDAVSTAFGFSSGRPPDRFLVGLGVLTLLSELAEHAPLLWVVDDAHWMDQASIQVLSFAARRLLADPVALLFVTRDPIEEIAGLPESVVDPLRDADARVLLGTVLPAPIDERVLDRIVFETAGNPLAILEWPRGLSRSGLAGGFAFPAPLSMSDQIEESYRRRLAELPPGTQRLLTVAAADPTGDPALVWKAAHRLNIEEADAPPAIDAGFVEIGNKVLFPHPSARSAAYRTATTNARREAHFALAEVTDPSLDPDRRAWHRALATIGPNEEVAADLEESAVRARGRGGLAASAALLERSAMLTLDAGSKSARSLAAAEAHLEAGALERCAALLESIQVSPLTEALRARLEILQGHYAASLGDYRNAVRLQLSAARRLESVDLSMARATYVFAMTIAVALGHLGTGHQVDECAKAALAACSLIEDDTANPTDLLCLSLATSIVDGPAKAAPRLRRAVSAFRTDLLVPEGVRWYGEPCGAATLLWDYDSYRFFATRAVQINREFGALSFLPVALNLLALAEVFVGSLAAADALVGEAHAINEITKSRIGMYAQVPLACARGREIEARAAIDQALDGARTTSHGLIVKLTQCWAAMFCNGLGRYVEALAFAQQSTAEPMFFGVYQALPELIEAAVRSGHVEVASEAYRRLTVSTSASGTEWALGIEARSHALLSSGDGAEALYIESIDRLSDSALRADAARAHLLYGEWLRREGRRVDARARLRAAYEALSALGLEAFAERARVELLATGERVRRRTAEARLVLTSQEVQIARMASTGHTNPEIAAQLFLSARTVEWHLRKVFTKLDIKSRRQLRGVLPRIEQFATTQD